MKIESKLERYEALCKQLGEPPAAVALAWLLHNPDRDCAHHRPANNRAIGIYPARDGDHA